jgi:hypothetical protein
VTAETEFLSPHTVGALFLLALAAPMFAYLAVKLGWVKADAGSRLLGWILVIAGLSVVALGVWVFLSTGEVIVPLKHGEKTVGADASVFRKLWALFGTALLVGACMYGAWTLMRKPDPERDRRWRR